MGDIMGKRVKQHDGINMLKGVACIVVVFLHISFPGIIGKLIGFFLNFSVPVFFMISGYFAYMNKDECWYKKKFIQSLKMIIYTELLYGLWYFLLGSINGKGLEAISTNLQKLYTHPVRTLLCGTVFNGTLWYVYAAMWGWAMYFLLKRYTNNGLDLFFWSIIPLTFIQVFGKLYWMNMYDITSHIYLFRNAIVFGFPMMLLGSWIAKNQTKLLPIFDKPKATMIILGGVF